MWTFTKRLFVLIVILLWQPIQLLVFARKLLFVNDERMTQIAVAYDILANVALNGREKETISSRTGRGYLNSERWAKLLRPLIDSVFGEGHCVSEAKAFLEKGE